jgi:hypothetical protein
MHPVRLTLSEAVALIDSGARLKNGTVISAYPGPIERPG